jgi:alkylation response protein AidB-like acyl-CoA dehydrogenase
VEVAPAGLPLEEREMILSLLSQVRERMLTPEKIREWDDEEIFPEEQIRELLSPDIGLQLLFIPAEFGGMGGGARDMAAFSEEMAKICLGVATAFLAIHLGADPILVGATQAQKQKWLSKLADKFYGDVLAYPAIFEATNAAAEADSTYATVANADLIEVGWKLCIPPAEEAQMTVSAEAEETASEMDALIAAAQAEGMLTTIALPHDWLNYGFHDKELNMSNSKRDITPVESTSMYN